MKVEPASKADLHDIYSIAAESHGADRIPLFISFIDWFHDPAKRFLVARVDRVRSGLGSGSSGQVLGSRELAGFLIAQDQGGETTVMMIGVRDRHRWRKVDRSLLAALTTDRAGRPPIVDADALPPAEPESPTSLFGEVQPREGRARDTARRRLGWA